MKSGQSKYQLLIESLSDGFAYHEILTDSDGFPVDYIFLDVNSAFEKITGLSRDKILGKKATEVYLGIEESHFDWVGTYGKMALSGESICFEHYHGPSDCWYKITAYSYEPGCFATIYNDITEHKKSSGNIVTKAKLLQSTIDAIQDGISVLDKDLIIQKVNQTMEQWYAHAMPLTGKKCYQVYQNRQEPCDPCPSIKAMKEMNTQVEVRPLIDEQDQVGWLELFSYPLTDEQGTITGVVEYVRDITNRKKVEEELRESKAFIKSVMDNLPIGIAVNSVDPTVTFEYMNDNFFKFYRTTRAALTETNSFWKTVYEDAEFSKKLKQRVLDDCASGDPVRMRWEDIPVTRTGQETFFITAMNIPVPDKPLMISTVWDVTKRKRAEEALRKSEENLLITLNSIGDAVIATDENGLIVRMNPMAEKLCGWPFLEAKGKPLTNIFQIINSETREHVSNPVDIVLEKGEVIGLANHTALISRDGTEYQIADSAAPIKNNDGLIIGVVLVFSDISEDYALRKKIATSELRWQFALEGAGDGVWDWNAQTNKVFYSRQWKKMLGYEEHEVGNTLEEWDKRIHPEDKHRCYEELEQHFRGETPVYQNEHRVRCKDGTYKWILDRGKVFEWTKEGKPLRVIGIHSDINYRKQAEEALRESEIKFKDLFNHAGDAIFIHELEGGFLEVNQIACERLNYTREELLQMRLIDIDSPEYCVRTAQQIQELQQHGHVIFETAHVRKDGSVLPNEISSRIIKYNGQPAIMSVARDITERKEAERALKFQLQFEKMLSDISTFLINMSLDNLDDGINHALNLAGQFFQANRSYIFQFSTDGQKMSITHEWCAESIESQIENMQNFNVYELPWLTEQIITKEHIYIADIDKLPPEAEAEKRLFQSQNVYSMLCIPIITNDTLFGFFGLDAIKENQNKSKECIALVKITTQLIANAFYRHMNHEKIRYLSFYDSLTGLYNRTYLEEEMNRLDTIKQLPVSVIMADLNGLKLVNDTYGHSTGDEILKSAAEILRKSCREVDIIARWGGDEFVILLPQTTEKQALEMYKKINAVCNKTCDKDIPISIALGVESKKSVEQTFAGTLKKAEDKMYRHKLTESRSARSAVLNNLLKTLGTKSYETAEHTKRMQEVALKIGEKIDLPDTELRRLGVLITLHDIGKINIPEDILTKRSVLTAEEWVIIKKHPEIGFRIARGTEEFAHVAEDILTHHEHWDGTGYPLGLKGEEIPLLARITTIADAYEVMTYGRPYKKALSPDEVVAELKRCAGTQFDPKLIDIFLSTT